MCGIAGYLRKSAQAPPMVPALQAMASALAHRGPDGEGYLLINETRNLHTFGTETPKSVIQARQLHALPNDHEQWQLGFAHRRLAIIDLSEGGHQPLSTDDGDWSITYNGEIYNYKALREKLSAQGCIFRTQSDTEVILQAYKTWGEAMLEQLDGMWALAIYDHQKQEIFCARDRLGVKPFYYVDQAHVFAFASEQKALLASGLIEKRINETVLFDYFITGQCERNPGGIFKGIMELMPGHCMRLSAKNTGTLHPQLKWYTLPARSTSGTIDLTCLKNSIQEAVLSHTVADVAVGACLSGGIDSSAIACILAAEKPEAPLHLFTARFDNFSRSEHTYAKKIAEHTKASWHCTSPHAKGLLAQLETLAYAQDLPLWSTSTYAQFSVMQLVQATGLKVVLDGQGADELFAGYPHHRHFLANGMMRQGQVWAALQQSGITLLDFLRFSLGNTVRKRAPEKWLLNKMSRRWSDLQYVNHNFLMDHRPRLRELITAGMGKTLDERLRFETQLILKTYLKCEDRCAMWHSVESRTPFSSSKQLIDSAYSIPEQALIEHGILKAPMRKALRGLVPESILHRKDKVGFETPNNLWLSQISSQIAPFFSEALSPYLNTQALRRDSAKHFNQPAVAEDGRLFKLLAFAAWHKAFFQ